MPLKDLLTFLDDSPTAWHAIDSCRQRLNRHGFEEIHEGAQWKLRPGGRYLVTRQGASLCAFVMPLNTPTSMRLLASHTDSPALKLKPKPEIRKQNMILFGVEVYGAPLLSSWLNRDLGIAGKVIYEDRHGHIKESLINLSEYPLVIPQLAIHLDREVNEKGLLLNKQEHLNALAALDNGTFANGSYLETLLKTVIDLKELLNFDLYLYPLECARFVGYEKQMIASYRIDSLASVHAILTAFNEALEPLEDEIKMIAFWNHEEVGSQSTHGAGSPFLLHILERIMLASGAGREEFLRLLPRSSCISVDLTHAVHPNYPDKHDAQHQPLFGKGVVLKANAQQRYASDAHSALPVQLAAKQQELALQRFVSRNDVPSGTTIGPIHATLTGIPTVDIGAAQLSMHSSRELMASQDQLDLCKLLKGILTAKTG